MAIADPYATADEYKLQKGKTSAVDDASLERELVAISRYLDQRLGRMAGFNKDAAVVARIYRPRWGGVLDIDDLVSLGSPATGTVKLDSGGDGTYGTTLATADFEFLPLNAAVGPEARPYRQIALTSWGSYGSWAPGRVKITAIWGWPAVPAAIVAATIELTAILRVESPRATSTVNEVGAVIGMSRPAQDIISELKRAYLNPAVLV